MSHSLRRLRRGRYANRYGSAPHSANQEVMQQMKSLPRLTSLRIERLRARVPILQLCAESGIGMEKLSRAERGLVDLAPNEERGRREALLRLKKKNGEISDQR